MQCCGGAMCRAGVKAAGNVMAGKYRNIIGQEAEKFCLDI